MPEHKFTITVHTEDDRLAARMAVVRLLNADADIWEDILEPLDGEDNYITLDTSEEDN